MAAKKKKGKKQKTYISPIPQNPIDIGQNPIDIGQKSIDIGPSIIKNKSVQLN
jgi:hypothetical protein